MLDVCLLGSGGMMPLPYRWLTALMTRYNGSQLLIDCGEGTHPDWCGIQCAKALCNVLHFFLFFAVTGQLNHRAAEVDHMYSFMVRLTLHCIKSPCFITESQLSLISVTRNLFCDTGANPIIR